MKRSTAAFMLFMGLTAMMIGLYLNEAKSLSELLKTYVMQIL